MKKFKRLLSLTVAVAMLLSVSVVPTVFAEDINMTANVVVGESYTLPQADADGNKITWNTTEADTSDIGVQTFYGTCGDGNVTLTLNVGYYETIIADNLEAYDANTKPKPESDKGGISASSANVSVAYENGVSGNKVFKIAGGDKSTLPNASGFDGIKLPGVYSGSFRVTAKMRFNNENSPTPDGKTTFFMVNGSSGVDFSQNALGGLYIRRLGEYVELRNTVDCNKTSNSGDKIVTKASFKKALDTWTEITMDFDAVNRSYDVYADDAQCLSDIPYDFDISHVSSVIFAVRSENYAADVLYDDITVEKFVYPAQALPSGISATVQQGTETKEYYTVLPLDMNDGSTRNFTVKYTVDTSVPGVQNVDGTIDGFTQKIPVSVTVSADAVMVHSINDELNVTKYIGESAALPQTVGVTLSNGETDVLGVSWNAHKVDTSQVGTYTYLGYVTGYDGVVVYTLNVEEDTPVSVESLKVSVLRNQQFTLPEYATAKMASGATKIYSVDWGSQSADTAVAGVFYYTGTIEGGLEVSLELTVSELEYGVTYTSDIVGVGDSYTLPDRINGNQVTWDAESTAVDTGYKGTQAFTAADNAGGKYNFTVNVGDATELVSDDFEEYSENSQPNYNVGDMALGLMGNCAIAADPEDETNMTVKMTNQTGWHNFDLITPTIPDNDYVVSGRIRVDGENNAGALLILYNLGNEEIAGIRIYKQGNTLQIKNGRNINGSAAYPVNPGSEESGITIAYPEPKWIDFKIVVDVSEKTYSVFADSRTVRLNVPCSAKDISDVCFKTISIADRTGTVAEVYFDDLDATQYTYVTEKLPSLLSDNVVAIDNPDAVRTQKIYLKQNNGEYGEFTVSYDVDLTQSGTQMVVGRVDGFNSTINVEVNVDARTIIAVDNIEETVYAGADYVLPSRVTAVMSDDSTRELNVDWGDSVPDTSVPTPDGEPLIFTGTVTGWYENITLTLTVIDDYPASVEPIYETVEHYAEYTLPQTVEAVLVSGNTATVKVDWNGQTAHTNKADTITYTGFVKGYPDIPVTLVLTVEAVQIAGYRDSELDILVKSVEDMPATVACVYENGKIGFEEVEWDMSAIGDGYGPYSVTGTVEGYSEPVTASVKVIDLPDPALYDGLDTLTFDTEFQDKKFSHGSALRLSPFSSQNSPYFKCVYDPTGEVEDTENLVMRYECSSEFPTSYNMHYETITMSATDEDGRGGVIFMEADLWLPYDFTEFRMRLLAYGGGEVSTISIKRDDRTISQTLGAFPVEEWFRLGIVVDSTSMTEEQLAAGEVGTYDFYINGILIESGLKWKGTPTETNGIGTGVISVNFANRSDEDGFVCYLDNVNLYALNDCLKAAVESIPYDREDLEPEETTYNSVYEDTTMLTLPSSYSDGTTITWKSSQPKVINPETGVITTPAYGSGQRRVIMTATLSKEIGDFLAKDDINYIFNVYPKTDESGYLVDAAIAAAADKLGISDNAVVTADLELLKEHNSVNIAWKSSHPDVIDEQGRVFNPAQDTTVVLTATATHGSAEQTYEITVTVPHQEEESDLQKIRKVMNQISLPSVVSSNLTLPKSKDGVAIDWRSGNVSVISNDGVIAPGNHNTTVVMTARFSCGSAIDEKAYSITVSVSSGNIPASGGSGGGGGGGGYVSNAVQTTPTVEAVPNPVSDSKFEDLDGYLWASDAINELNKKGIINGVSDTLFMPAANVRREEFAALIVRLLKLDSSDIVNNFKDVTENDWFFREINIAYAHGLISGIGDNMAGAGYNITRQDMAVILYNAARKLNVAGVANGKAPFSDYDDIAPYAATAIDFLAEKGVINGSDGKMLPKNYATRAEAAKMIYEFVRIFDVENISAVDSSVAETPEKNDSTAEQTPAADVNDGDIYAEDYEPIEEVDANDHQNELDSIMDSIADEGLQQEEITTD